MPMIDIQRRHAEVFRVRLGDRDGVRPRKLTDSIRITAPSKGVVEAFTAVYGGEVSPWEDQWQTYLPTTELRILVLPGQSVQQWWELYRGSVCERRCDGYLEQKSGKRCMCPEDVDERMKDKTACSPTTRVNVICPDVAVVGAGALVTHGLIAAETLPQSIAVAEGALARGFMVPAILRVVEHKGRNHFVVPQIEITGVSLYGLGGDQQALPHATNTPLEELEGRGRLIPVPQLPGGPAPSIAEQSQPPQPRPRRRNAAPPIPASGRTRRTTEQPSAEPAPPAATQPEQSVPEAAEPGVLTPASAAPAGSGRSTPAPADAPCTHPVDEQLQTKSGATVCGICGERVAPTEQAGGQAAATAPDEEGQPARQPKTPDDEAYWPSRVHAVAGERGIDHDGLRLIGAALKRIPADEVGAWSMTSLSEAEWEGLDKLLRRLPASLDVDAATLWIWPIAEAKGLGDWEAIDALATALYGKAADEITVPEWIAWGLRAHAGAFDSSAAQ